MYLLKMNIKSFRKIKNVSLDFDKRINILLGKNAQGKTTFLESIYFTSFSKSYKTSKEKEIINFDSHFSKISALFKNENQKIKSEIVISEIGRKVWLNNVEQKKLSNYIGEINSVIFSNEDLNLIKGTPKDRRKFLDLEIGQLYKNYLYNLSFYNNVLKQRNSLLKDFKNNQNFTLLDTLTEQLIEYLIIIINMRIDFLSNIKEIMKKYVYDFSNELENIDLLYKSTLPLKYIINKENKEIFEIYKKNYDKDILYKMTNIGLHRDDFDILINNGIAKNFASGGQLKSVLIALKLSLVKSIYNVTKKTAIILLDDVFSELDSYRQKKLFSLLPISNQVFISTTSLADIDEEILKDAAIFEVVDGVIKNNSQKN